MQPSPGRPLRIGITCYPTYGGSGIVATELGMELAARGYEVHFITYANPIRLDPGLPRIFYHEVEAATYPLFQFRLMIWPWRRGCWRSPSGSGSICSTCTMRFRTPPRPGWRGR